LTALLCPLSVSPGQQPTTAEPLKRYEAGAIDLIVPLDGAASLEVVQDISLSAELRKLFPPENPVAWYPEETQEPLRPVLRNMPFGKDLPSVTVGTATQPGELTIHCDREPLNQKRQFRLRLREPQNLKAGVYDGEIVFRLKTFRPQNFAARYVYRVRLYVLGRAVVSVQFSGVDPRAAAARLAVGDTASVKALVLAVSGAGDAERLDVGEGVLDLLWKSDRQGASSPKTVLRVPLPLATAPTDLEIDLPARTNSLCPDPSYAWDEWQYEVIHGVVPTEVQAEGLRSDYAKAEAHLYQVEAQLPDLFRTGELQAAVQWRRGAVAKAGTVQGPRPAVAVGPGMVVSPRHAAVGEEVQISIATADNLGRDIPLVVSDADGANAQPASAVLTEGDNAGPEKGPRTYVTTFTPAKFGTFQVTLAGTASKEQQAELATARAAFAAEFQQAIYPEPVVVYAGNVPFWWDFFYDPASYARKCGEFHVIRAADRTRMTEISLKAVYRYNGENDLTRLHEKSVVQREPELKLSKTEAAKAARATGPDSAPAAEAGTMPSAGSGDGTADRPLGAPRANEPADPQAPDTWIVTDNGITLGLRVGLDPEDQLQERNATGIRTYVFRTNVQCQSSDGRRFARVVNIPLTVRIKTCGEDYLLPGVIAGILIAIVLVSWIIHRGMHPRKKAAEDQSRTIVTLPEEDDVDPYAVSSKPTANAAAHKAATRSPDERGKEEPETGGKEEEGTGGKEKARAGGQELEVSSTPPPQSGGQSMSVADDSYAVDP
jgi:hypothetical protein